MVKKRKLVENRVIFPADFPAAATLSHDDIRKVIEPFTHEQLFQIVLTASLHHLDVLDAVRSIADRDPSQRKLFIRGLGWETTTEKLKSLYAAYGDIEEAVVILDKVTGMSKGYGFVTFKHIDGALTALKEPSKKIDGRMTVTSLASAGITSGVTVNKANSQTLDASSRKIYVGNVPPDLPGETLLAHFSSYGEVEEGPLGFDKNTGKPRGYALFIYKTVEGARASLVDPVKSIDGHQLNCKFANDSKRGNPSVVAAPVAKGGHVQGSGDGIKPEVVNLNQQSSIQGPFGSQFGGGGPDGSSAYGRNVGGLGLPGGPGGISSYGGGGQGPPFGHSHHPQNLNLGSFGGNGDGMGLPTNGSQGTGSLGGGGRYGGSHVGGPGPRYGGTGSGGGVGFGNGGGSGFLTNMSQGSGSLGGGVGGGGYGASYGGTGSDGGMGLGTGFGGSRQRSHYGLPPGSMRMSSGGYPESAHYSLSSGTPYK